MLFVAVPWFLAAGMIGLLPAVVLGGISGLFLAYLDTHNIFTPLIFMSLALIFGWCIRQRYRTISFRILRFPLFAALMSICLVSPLIFIASVLSVSGNIITKITFAIDGFLPILLAATGIVFFAGMISVIVGIIFNKSWGVHTSLQPAPGERSILFRYLSTTIPLLSGLLIILLVLNWGIGEKLARRSVIEEMTLTSDFAEDALTLAIETSTNLVKDIGNEATVITGNPETVAALFATQLANTPFVDHLVLVDMEGRVIARFPDEDGFDSSLIPNRDLTGLENVPQIFTLPSGQTNQTARIGFAYDVNNAEGETTRILWGETVLMNNPLTQSAINVLTRFSDKGGYAQIVDQQGAILFSTNSTQMMPSFREMVYDTSTFIEDTTADGTSTITYFQPLDSAGLAVIVSSPAIIIQEFTLESSLPFVFVGLTLMIGLLIFGLIVLVPLQKDIHQVSTAAEKIRFGNFDFNLSKSYSQGTAGQMVAKMDSMAETLRKRNYNPMDFAISFEELDVNAQLTSALHPVMQAAIMHGASNVRIILLNDLGKLDEDRSWARFGLGEQVKSFSALDHIIVAGAKRYEPTILIDSQIEKSMHLKGNIPTPKSIIAMPLHWDREWLGNLWVTFHDRNKPSENDISLLKEYAEKASSIVIQVRNLRKTMIIKKQMEDLLELLPEAVIISDQNSRIVYHNEVAQAMFGFDQKSLKGTKLNHFLDDEVFQDVLERGKNKLQLEEVQMKTGQVLHIITTPLGFDAGIESQGTIIRDITEQKRIETESARLQK
ncbi:MAG: PAS domain S-box protein, partial [Anaerolineales bacterium]